MAASSYRYCAQRFVQVALPEKYLTDLRRVAFRPSIDGIRV